MTEEDRERRREYRRTEKGREALRRYNASPAAKAQRKKYRSSAKGKEAARARCRRRRENPAFRARENAIKASPEYLEKRRERDQLRQQGKVDHAKKKERHQQHGQCMRCSEKAAEGRTLCPACLAYKNEKAKARAARLRSQRVSERSEA